MKLRWRVTQYQSLSELGDLFAKGFYGRSAGTVAREETGHTDYRWLWLARLSAKIYSGESAGLGLRIFTTTITDLDTGEQIR